MKLKIKNKKTIIILLAVLLIIGIISIILIKRKKEISESGSDDSFPLHEGSTGANVKLLQSRMNTWMANSWDSITTKPKYQYGANTGKEMKSIDTDGKFGKNTLEFVKIVFFKSTVTKDDFDRLK